MSAEIISFPKKNQITHTSDTVKSTKKSFFSRFFKTRSDKLRFSITINGKSKEQFEYLMEKNNLNAVDIVSKSLAIYDYYMSRDLSFYTFQNGEFVEILFSNN